MMVEMGADRIHHGIWSYMEPDSPAVRAGQPLEMPSASTTATSTARSANCSRCAGRHGHDRALRPRSQGRCRRHLLQRVAHHEGYLGWRADPDEVTPINKAPIDWGQTQAWGDGGYYGRLFMNVGARAEGIDRPADYETVRDELIAKIEAIIGPPGKPMGNKARRPEEIYREATAWPGPHRVLR